MIPNCQGCNYCRSGEEASKMLVPSLCRVYLYPEVQWSRVGGCAMRTHNRTKAVEERAFVDPLKLSKRTQKGVKS